MPALHGASLLGAPGLPWPVTATTCTETEITPDRAAQEGRRVATLAQWEAGAEGIRWIERLVEAGRASKLAGNGYPNRYTARAANVLPLFGEAPAPPHNPLIVANDYAMPTSGHGEIEVHANRCAACQLDHLVTAQLGQQQAAVGLFEFDLPRVEVAELRGQQALLLQARERRAPDGEVAKGPALVAVTA